MKKPTFELHLKVFSENSPHAIVLNAYKFSSLKALIPDDKRIISQVSDCSMKQIPLQPIVVNFTTEEWDLFQKEVKSKISKLKGIPAELYYRSIPIVFFNKPE